MEKMSRGYHGIFRDILIIFFLGVIFAGIGREDSPLYWITSFRIFLTYSGSMCDCVNYWSIAV